MWPLKLDRPSILGHEGFLIQYQHRRRWVEVKMSAQNLHQVALSGNQDIAVLIALNTTMLNSELPLSSIFLPPGANYPGVQLHVAIEVPLLCRALNIFVD